MTDQHRAKAARGRMAAAAGGASAAPCRESRAKIISSGLWSLLDVGANLVFGTAIVFVLAHLIGPAEYGNVAIAMSAWGWFRSSSPTVSPQR